MGTKWGLNNEDLGLELEKIMFTRGPLPRGSAPVVDRQDVKKMGAHAATGDGRENRGSLSFN
jgi:hypothetical protein